MRLISFVIPAYNEAENIGEINSRIKNEMGNYNYDYEVVFVDDGSKDATALQLESMAKEDSHVVAVSFSRNFGKEAAVFCGLSQSHGDAVIVMDADMQHPVTLVGELLSKWEEGYVIVEAKKKSRQKEGVIYKFFSKLFYRGLNNLAGIELNNLSDFKLIDRQAVDVLNALTEKQTFFRALSGWMGFKTCFVEFEVADRFAGETKWSFSKLVKYAINNITSFSAAPLQFVTIMGMVFLLFALLLAVNTLYNFYAGIAVSGFTTTILAILITGSLIMISLGVIGHYLAKIYDELKNRPRYIIQKVTRGKDYEK